MEQMGMDEEAAVKYLNVSTMFTFVKYLSQKINKCRRLYLKRIGALGSLFKRPSAHKVAVKRIHCR